eukprot:tig00020704_g13177.t1
MSGTSTDRVGPPRRLDSIRRVSSRLLRGAVESAVGATLRALLLVTLAPVTVVAIQMVTPYHSIESYLARVAVFAAVVGLGTVLHSMSQFQLYARCEWRHVAFTWPLIHYGVGIPVFVAANAAVDLSRVPFGYAIGVVTIVVAGQVNGRFHTARLQRLAARVQAEDGFADAESLRASRPPVDINFYFRRASVASLAIFMLPVLYLFVFSAVSTASGQIAINIATSVLSYLLMAILLRVVGRQIYEALPDGDALTIFILQSLTKLRVFRQLCYFRVRSLEVFAVSLVLELLAVTFPASLLADRFGRPALRQFKFLARRFREKSDAAPALAPARGRAAAGVPRPSSLPFFGGLPSPTAGEAGCDREAGGPAVRARRRSVSGDFGAEEERPAARSSPPAAAAAAIGAASSGARPASTSSSTALLAGASFAEDGDPELEGPGGERDGYDSGSDSGVSLQTFQTGVRSMLVLNAIACWVGCATFAVGVCVARWGPAHASFPFSPVTFDDGSFAAAMATTGISAAAHAGLLLVFQVVGWVVPDLREKLGLASSWGVLRRHWLTIAMMFSVSTTIPFLALYRYSNIYAYVFPGAYEGTGVVSPSFGPVAGWGDGPPPPWTEARSAKAPRTASRPAAEDKPAAGAPGGNSSRGRSSRRLHSIRRISRRLLRSAVESAPAVAASAGATLRALLLVTLAPVVMVAIQMVIPYHAIASHVGRAALFVAVVGLGTVLHSMSQFQLYAQCEWRHIAFTWPLIYLALFVGIFVAVNAAVDLSRVPFGYATGVVNTVIASQVNSRFHAFRLRRLAARVQAEDGLADAKSLQEALRSPRSSRPGDNNFYFRRLAVVSLAIYVMPVSYLFVFSAVSAASAQIAINIATSVLSYLLMAILLRFVGLQIYEALPDGDALTIFILESLTKLRVFRQLCYFRVRSLEVFAVSLVLELLAVTFPASLLADRFGRPVLRQFKFLARRIRDKAVTTSRASLPVPSTLPRSDREAGEPAVRARWRSVSGDFGAEEERPAARASPPAAAAAAAMAAGFGGPGGPSPAPSAATSTAMLAAPVLPEGVPELEGYDADRDGYDSGSDSGVSLQTFQTGVRSMLVLNAIACWVGCATFAVGVCVARWGPAHASFPFSPVTFDDGSFAAAMATTGISAAAHAGLLLVFQVVGWVVPDLREKLGLASSWGVLRRHWLTIAMMFCASTVLPLLTLYRYSNIYAYVFPEAYEALP